MASNLQEQTLQVQSIAPKFGVNYNRGYVGFTYNNNLLVCKGIAYFTRWAKMSDIYATHVLIVTGEDSCIEANAFKNQVESAPLKHYFDDPYCQIFFRKPKGLTDGIADRIIQVLEPEVGARYDFGSIFVHALSGMFLGYLLNRLLRGVPKEQIGKILTDPKKWICSELVAYGLDKQPEYKNQGILKSLNATISPQALFEDEVIFEPWDHKEYSNNETSCS
ncbi:hypothetical protein ACN4EK_24305 [Pantanalinema rosaneae CENA516]|uniref:hypothetical protein n=1 Tax=Pantanalinema rosaneae TaxID=1620701 RepID=UPI003D6F78C6